MLTAARKKVALDQVAYAYEARGLKILKILGFSRCNECKIVDGVLNKPNRVGCNVIETIIVLKFPQVRGSLQLARKVALDQVGHKNETTVLKSVKIQTFGRCNEGTIVDGTVKNPNCTGCIVIESTEISQVHETLLFAINVSLHKVTCENEARGLNCLKIQAFSWCKKGTIDDGPVKNSIRDGCNVIETIGVSKFPQVQGSMQLARKVAEDQIAYENED